MKGYQNLLCVMDTGDGEMFIPMPVVGHWLKKAWANQNKDNLTS